MSASKTVEAPPPPPPAQLLDRMVEAKQLSVADAGILGQQAAKGKPELVQSEEHVLRWLAKEYDLNFTDLVNIEPDRELLSLFPARVLLKEEFAAVAPGERGGAGGDEPTFFPAGFGYAEDFDGIENPAGAGAFRGHSPRNQEPAGHRRGYD